MKFKKGDKVFYWAPKDSFTSTNIVRQGIVESVTYLVIDGEKQEFIYIVDGQEKGEKSLYASQSEAIEAEVNDYKDRLIKAQERG
jgi:hypothetical protein